MCQPGLRALTRSYPGLLSFAHFVGEKFRSPLARQTRICLYCLMMPMRNLRPLITLAGSGTYIDDFEEQLVGAHPGETVKVNVTFPEGYTEELGGKDAVFEVTINGVYE